MKIQQINGKNQAERDEIYLTRLLCHSYLTVTMHRKKKKSFCQTKFHALIALKAFCLMYLTRSEKKTSSHYIYINITMEVEQKTVRMYKKRRK